MHRNLKDQPNKQKERPKGEPAAAKIEKKDQRPNKLSHEEVEHLRKAQGSGHS
jgi:hypothetical protein